MEAVRSTGPRRRGGGEERLGRRGDRARPRRRYGGPGGHQPTAVAARAGAGRAPGGRAGEPHEFRSTIWPVSQVSDTTRTKPRREYGGWPLNRSRKLVSGIWTRYLQHVGGRACRSAPGRSAPTTPGMARAGSLMRRPAQARAKLRRAAARRPRAIRAYSMAFRPLFAAKPRENRSMCAACPKNKWATARDACNGKGKSPAQGRGARRKLDPAAPASLAPGLNPLDIADSPKPKQLLNALPVVRNDAAPGTLSVAYAVHSICGLGTAYKPSQMHKRRVCGCLGAPFQTYSRGHKFLTPFNAVRYCRRRLTFSILGPRTG